MNKKNIVVNIKKILEQQVFLDDLIFKNNQTNYKQTSIFRKLATLVEIGEFANEIKVFKFWSKKADINKENAIDELVDVMHFLCSLLVEKESQINQIKLTTFKIAKTPAEQKKILSKQFLKLFELVLQIDDEKSIIKAIGQLLSIGVAIGFSWKAIEAAYKQKNLINIQRQNNDY